MTFDAFSTDTVSTRQTGIFVRWGGSGPPVLLLHGFPQTHLMWRLVAPLLARDFTVVCPDLRGYGRSGCPGSAPGHEPYAKRAMAQDMAEVMEHLGFAQFAAVGHDRGGRVAYRLALDHPGRVRRLAVLDIVPTGDAWEHAEARFASGTGRGRCWRSRPRCPSGCWRPRLTRSSTPLSAAGVRHPRRSAPTCGPPISRH